MTRPPTCERFPFSTRGQKHSGVKTPGFAKITRLMMAFCAVTAIAASAQTLTTLKVLGSTDGVGLFVSLVQGIDGNLYGTTVDGGVIQSPCSGDGCGIAFRLTPQGSFATIYSFCSQSNCADGWHPVAPLALGTDGNFYGVTDEGGSGSGGTAFKITPGGTLTTLYAFCAQANCADGQRPGAGLIQATDGNFYGTTLQGGIDNASCAINGSCGTVFKITQSGKLTTLYRFCTQTNCADGGNPIGRLIEGSDGNFYGITLSGGTGGPSRNLCAPGGCGTIFKMTPAGTLTTLYNFCPGGDCSSGVDGSLPGPGLVQPGALFYSTASQGGIIGNPAKCFNGCGTIFKVSPTGTQAVYRFCSQSNCTDGFFPSTEGMTLGSDLNLYGTTEGVGGNGSGSDPGTIFKFTPAGTLTTLYTFCSQSGCTDGFEPQGMIQGTDGNFYGATHGTLYRLSTGLAPFVSFILNSGKIGQTVSILGQGFTGTTAVSFNGTPASFSVISDTYLKATVPAGATTGSVRVRTPGGILKSNLVFRVTP